MDTKNEKGSFWTTVPGCITAVATLITAVGGLIAALYAITKPLPYDPPIAISSTATPFDMPPTLAPVVITDTPRPPSPLGS